MGGSTPSGQNNSLYQNFGLSYRKPSQPGRGAHRDRHDTRDGTWWTRVASARGWLQGGSHREQLTRAHTTGALSVRQNRVVLAPGVCAPSVAVMWRPNRVRASAIRKATGAIVHRSPGRARHKPSNHCAGKAGCLASPVCRCAAVLAHASHSGPRVPAGTRPSLRPRRFRGRQRPQSSGGIRRENGKPRVRLSFEHEDEYRSRAPDVARRPRRCEASSGAVRC